MARVALTFPFSTRAMAWRVVAEDITDLLRSNGCEVRWGDIYTYFSPVGFDRWISVDGADLQHLSMISAYKLFSKELILYVVAEGKPAGAPFTPVKLYSRIYTPSRFSRDMLKKWLGVDAEIMPHGINLAKYRNVDENKVREIRRKYEGKILAFYPCFNDPRKNIEFLIKTWCDIAWEVPEAHLLLNTKPIGYWNIPLLLEKYGKLNPSLEKHVTLTRGSDPIPFSQLLAYYHACDLLIFPSSSEGFGYPVLEAFSCGKPVLILDTFGVNELVEDGRTGLVVKTVETYEMPDPYTPGKTFVMRSPDPVDFIEKTVKLLTDPALRRRLGRNARREAEKYDYRRVYKPLIP